MSLFALVGSPAEGGISPNAAPAPGGAVPSDAIMVTPWSTGTGTGDAAVRDTDRTVPYASRKGTAADFEIVSASGLGFPAGMTNVAKSTCASNSPSNVGVRIQAASSPGLSTPAVGTDRYYRLYRRVDMPDLYISSGGDGLIHQPQDADSGTGNTTFQFEIYYNSDGTWEFEFYLNDTSLGANLRRYVLPAALTKGVVYRFEWRVHVVSSTTVWVDARVYDSSDVLLYSSEDFTRKTGLDTMAAQNIFTIPGVANLRGLQMGSNSWSVDPADIGGGLGDQISHYDGGLMIRTDDWCGAFSDQEEDW